MIQSDADALRGPKEEPVRISVVIFSCDQRRYLAEAVDSVLAQAERPWEILISDDASGDGSPELIRRYEADHPGLVRVLLNSPRRGIAAHKAQGLRSARGDWVTCLDGDDRFLPRKLEQESARLAAEPTAGMAYSNFRLIDTDGSATGIWSESPQPEGDIFAAVFARRFPRRMVFRNELVPRAALEDAGFYDETRITHEDWDLKIRLARHLRAVYNPELAAEYRRHPEAVSRRLRPEELLAELRRVARKNRPLLNARPAAERESVERELRVLIRERAREIAAEHRRSGRPLKALACLARFRRL